MAPSMVHKSATAYDANAKKRLCTSLGGTVLFFDLIRIDRITGLNVYILSDLEKLYRLLESASRDVLTSALFSSPA